MKNLIKKVSLFLVYLLGIHHIVRSQNKDKLTILLYHGVAPQVKTGIFNYRGKFIDPLQFEKHLIYLKKHYNILPLEKAVQVLQNNEPLPAHSLSITFDDGYRNNLTYAEPLLAKHDLTATVFVVTDFIDKKIPLWVDRVEYVFGHGMKYSKLSKEEKILADKDTRLKMKAMEDSKRKTFLEMLEKENGVSLQSNEESFSLYAPLSWEEIKESHGKHITYGAHTESHPILTNIPIQEAQREIGGSFRMLERTIQSPSNIFAYPNGQPGDFNEEVKRSTKELGFTAALTTVPGVNTAETDMFELRRFTLDAKTSRVEMILEITGTKSALKKLLHK